MKTISLEEYFSTRSQLEMEVLLKPNEYKLGEKVGRITQLFINAFPKIQYVIQDGDNIVWVTDEYSNPKKKSIFKV